MPAPPSRSNRPEEQSSEQKSDELMTLLKSGQVKVQIVGETHKAPGGGQNAVIIKEN